MNNPVAIITGAGGGIGASLVQTFSEAGYRVISTDKGPGDWLSCDLADPAQIELMVSKIQGPIHALVNNAGIPTWFKSMEETSVEEWDAMLAINLRAPWLLTKLLLPKFARGGSIVNIASLRASMSDDAHEPYSASKAGLVGLTVAMAVSLGRSHGIRVNAISPGWIVPPGQSVREVDHATHPVGRVGEPSDVANLATFLCSAEAGFITGAEYHVDGGMNRLMSFPE